MTAIPKSPVPAEEPLDEFHNGDRMTQPEFHRIYSRMPANVEAELIGGIVYMASPLKVRHGNRHLLLGTAFSIYEGNTAGVEASDNATVILGPDGEPQPDLFMRILPECGGQSGTTTDDYVDGAPELVAEVSHTTLSIDLHAKKRDYARYGVVEYWVLAVREGQLRRFDLTRDTEVPADADSVLRSFTFPGFWIDLNALFEKDVNRVLSTLQQGLATPEHVAFVERLAKAKQG